MIHPELPHFALSVRQPWAWALFNGKHVENRGPIALRGMNAQMRPGPKSRLLIHASTGMTRQEYESALLTFSKAGLTEWPRPDQLVRGAIIGVVTYRDCITKSASPWFFGPRALVFEDAELLPAPIPCLGELGFFDWRAPRCHERVTNRGQTRETRRPVKYVEEPKPWMKAWPHRYHPGAKAADGIVKAPEPMGLFEGDVVDIAQRRGLT